MFSSFKAVMDLWPSAEVLGTDVCESGNTVRKWRLRDSIPATHWAAVVASAQRRGFEQVTLELLAALASRPARKPGEDDGTEPKAKVA